MIFLNMEKCPNCGKRVDKLYEIEVTENGDTDTHEVCKECKGLAS